MTEKQKLFQELNDRMVKDLEIKDMEKENIKNEIKELRKILVKAMIKKDSKLVFIIKSKIKNLQINYGI